MLNAGLLVSRKAREVIGDDILKEVFERAKLAYAADLTDFVQEDIKQNDLRALLIVNETGRERWMEDLDQKYGVSPLAVSVIPSSWFLEKTRDYIISLLVAYSLRAEMMDLVYRVQPTRSPSVSRRSLLKFKLYEYKPYPVLFDEVHAEREINKAVESCPLGLIAKSPEGPSVTNPEKCTACGYCSASSYLGYLEVPTFTTEQFVSFVNSLVRFYPRPAGILFTDSRLERTSEGIFPFLVPCVASVHDSFVLATYAAGFIPIVHASSTCETRDMALRRLEELPSKFPGTNLEVRKAKSDEELTKVLETPLISIPRAEIPEEVSLNRGRRRNLLIWSINEMSKKVSLNQDDEIPGVYDVVVDPSKCVLCGVCVRACQMLVPDLSGGSELELSYNIPYCIGSQRCVKNCPENAITVPGFAKLSSFRKKVVNKASVAKCRICGKPIGSEKVKVRVDSMLLSQGFQGTAQYTDICNECKQKELTKMWVQRILGGKK
ncbi:4Fe-4S ferredoxin [Metallosphaera tengchongensis]|uniref:4Fe-4S ferredoxin n=1 Tax=Metallosphaera tengchongensis TaxID=1532350 RepID=A0A6N0NW65_9CREN|nr:4Fe-4S binding protein [Metallosphaera tengchongensis]QKR01106.1 4Fe-4S ferredoxin [Metallosphaera tengchongensis]